MSPNSLIIYDLGKYQQNERRAKNDDYWTANVSINVWENRKKNYDWVNWNQKYAFNRFQNDNPFDLCVLYFESVFQTKKK